MANGRNYANHSRFFYTNYREIEDHINTGDVNAYDIVLCSDTQEMLLIDDSFNLVPIHSRVYRFNNIVTAEEFLNTSDDTYQGQLVSILNLSTGTYQAYVVNKNNAGRFYVTSISVFDASDIDYNEIGHRPIEQVSGNIEQPVVLANLHDGLYKVEGAYKVSDRLITIFQGYSGDIISVTHNLDNTVSVKTLTSTSITDYLVSNNGDVIDRQSYATKEWVEAQGYMTEQYVDAKLEAMQVITRNEALIYIRALIQEGISDAVNQAFDDSFNARFDARLREQLQMEDQGNIRELFS